MILRLLSVAVVAAVVLLVSPSTVSAQNEVTKMLMGDWKGDAERTRKAMEDAGIDGAQIDTAMAQISKISITFGKDDAFIMKLDDPAITEDFTGVWTPKSEDAEKNTCTIVLEVEAAVNEKQDLVCTFLEMGQYVHIAAGAEPPIVFKRVKE